MGTNVNTPAGNAGPSPASSGGAATITTYAQARRPLTIKTTLPDDTFVVAAFEGREAISELYRFEVDLITEKRPSVQFDKLLGEPATLSLSRESGAVRRFSGIVCALEQGENVKFVEAGRTHEYTRFRVSIVPRLWLLSRTRRSRIFQRVTVPQILETVLQNCSPDFQLESTQSQFEERDYCVQYRETDLDFAMRLMEEEGIFFYFQHSASDHKMVVANSPASHPELTSGFRFEPLAAVAGEEDRIFEWRKSQEIRSGKYTLRDYTFERPANNLEVTRDTQESVEAGTMVHKLKVAGNSNFEIYDYPGGYAGRFDGIAKDGADQADQVQKIFTDNQRTVALRMQAEAASSMNIAGKGSVSAFTPGSKFQLQAHFCDNGPFVLTSVTHTSRQPIAADSRIAPFEYRNEFTCIPFALPFRPLRITPVPIVHGTHTAVVVGGTDQEIFTDRYGRVKVQFPWDRDGHRDTGSSCWIRVASAWAGKNRGAIHIPRVGDEVVVAFEEGDPNQPIIVGSVYNANNLPPYALPDNKTQSGLKTRSTPDGSGYNELRFEDKKGSEQIVVHAEKDLLTTIENDETRTVKHNRTTVIRNDETKTVQEGNETVTLQRGNQSLTITQGNQGTKISLGKSETEAMQSIELKVGQSSVKLDQTGVTIKGLTIHIEGQLQVQVKGLLTQISADTVLTAKGGIVLIN